MFGRKRVKPRHLNSLADLKSLVAEGKPVLIEFMRAGCRNCSIMDGIVSELAEEYGDSACVVKIDVGRVADAVGTFMVKATPTFLLFGRPAVPAAKKKAKRQPGPVPERADRSPVARWRASGLVRKDQIARALESAGAVRVEG